MNTGKRSSSPVDYNDDGVKRVQHSVNYGEIYTNFIKSFDGIVSLMESSSKEFLKKVYVDVETSSPDINRVEFLINKLNSDHDHFGVKDLISLLSQTLQFGRMEGEESLSIFTHCVNMLSVAHFYLLSLSETEKKGLLGDGSTRM